MRSQGKSPDRWVDTETHNLREQKPACHACALSRVRLCDPTDWGPPARQAPLSLGFSRQELWSGVPFPPLGDLPNPGMETASPASPSLAGDSLPLSGLGSPIMEKPELQLKNCWKVSVDKSESLELQGDPAIRGPPHFCTSVSPSGYWRIVLGSPAGAGGKGTTLKYARAFCS